MSGYSLKVKLRLPTSSTSPGGTVVLSPSSKHKKRKHGKDGRHHHKKTKKHSSGKDHRHGGLDADSTVLPKADGDPTPSQSHSIPMNNDKTEDSNSKEDTIAENPKPKVSFKDLFKVFEFDVTGAEFCRYATSY